jgi:hypothetical protein
VSGPTPADAPPAPGRPDLAPPVRPRPRRRFLPTVVVFLTIVVVVLGGFVVAAALVGPAGPPVDVAGVVRVRPVPGWELASRGTLQGTWETAGGTVSDVPFVRLTRGSASLDLAVVPGYGGTPEDLARWYASEVLSQQLTQLSISDVRSTDATASGAATIRFAYLGVHGTAIEGDVVVVVSPRGTGVIFDAWAAQGALASSLDDVARMIREAEVA